MGTWHRLGAAFNCISGYICQSKRFSSGMAKQSCMGDLGFKKCHYLLRIVVCERNTGASGGRGRKTGRLFVLQRLRASQLQALSAGK